MTCLQQDAAQLYVAGTLSGDELEAFEVHLLTCAECRDAVHIGDRVRAGLAAPTVAASGSRRNRVVGVGLLAAAAALLAVLFRPDSPFAELTHFAVPSFEGGAARADADSMAAAVDRGMAAFGARDYRAAARELTSAETVDSTPALAFYLGVARFMSGDAPGALRALARAQVPLGNPYEVDARLLTAKAWLRLGQPDSALVSLGDYLGDDAAAAARIRALADSIRRVRR